MALPTWKENQIKIFLRRASLKNLKTYSEVRGDSFQPIRITPPFGRFSLLLQLRCRICVNGDLAADALCVKSHLSQYFHNFVSVRTLNDNRITLCGAACAETGL